MEEKPIQVIVFMRFGEEHYVAKSVAVKDGYYIVTTMKGQEVWVPIGLTVLEF